MNTALAKVTSYLRALRLPEGWADLTLGQVRYQNGQGCTLSNREAELLRFLAAHVGRPVSRDEILTKVWRLDPRKTLTRTIDMHIAHLRSKLRDDSARPRVLVTIHGKGYMLKDVVARFL
jgi:two-component system, OmpR family, alkaline phosphatase synthesis response regulator PhoP